jgi:hypothetical protein
VGLGTAWLVTLPFPAEIRVAAALPWAWWFVGVGVATLVDWRAGTARLATVGVMAWLALHLAARPWGHERQQAALVGTWAHAMAEGVTGAQPLITDTSPVGRLLSTLVVRRALATAAPSAIAPREARDATRAGRHPVVFTAAQLDTLRWGGTAFAPWTATVGASIENILQTLPRGTVTLAVISAEAAGRMSPREWRALGRIGLRLPDASTGRAHALVGLTGARGDALEVAQAGSVRLDVQPGDPLGRTAARAPMDARLEADARRVSIWLRGQVFLDRVEGLALAFFTTRGDLLGWRSGSGPAHLDGPPLGVEPATRAMAVAALPCMTIAAGRETDVTALTDSSALGVTWSTVTRLDVTVERPREWQASVMRLARTGTDASGPMPIDNGMGDRAFAVQGQSGDTAGVYLRGPVSSARARADHDVQVCAAWPMALALVPAPEPIAIAVAPRHEPYFGGGWHEMEVQPGVGYFRWMSGPRAQVLVPLQGATRFRFALDAQAPLAPEPGDVVRLMIAGREIGALTVLPTRGIYSWEVPADAVRAGVNALTIAITRTARPAEGQSRDTRQLGLLVRGWSITAVSPRQP